MKYELQKRIRAKKDAQKYENILKKIIYNPNDFTVFYDSNSSELEKGSKSNGITKALSISSFPSATDGFDVEYIIITNEDLVEPFERLANYKIKEGIVTVIKTVSWIIENYPGCDTQEKIRHFIQDAYIKWNTDYVLLGGDTDIIPARVNDFVSHDPVTDL